MSGLDAITQTAQPLGESVSRARPQSRIAALDWTKGALVMSMVVYHAICLHYRGIAFRFLAFLPPSFILITGFLVGQIYAAKYDADSWKPYARLMVRGAKLLLLFTALNVVRCIFLERSLYDGFGEFAERSNAIFLSGNGRTGIFEVLLPIAYFLLLAPGLLWLRSRVPGSVIVAALLVFLFCLHLEMTGRSSKNLVLLSAGFIGVAFGLARMETIDRFAGNWFLVVLLYLAYRLMSFFLGEIYLAQMAAVVATLFLLYAFALRLSSTPWLGQEIIMVGQYSLFAYLAQIALLQAVVRIVGGEPAHWPAVISVALLTTALLFLSVRALHLLRRRNHFADSVYRSVFA